MKYKKGYKYQLEEREIFEIWEFNGMLPIFAPFISLVDGCLKLEKGYAWDGASGFTIDTPSTFRGSAGHDALYQLMRKSLLPVEPNREMADKYLLKWLINSGMWKWRANIWYRAVRKFAEFAATEPPKKIIEVQ